MKQVFILIAFFFLSTLSFSQKATDITVSPVAILAQVDGDSHWELNLEYQIDDDFGIQVSFINSSLIYTIFESKFNSNQWNRLILQPNLYLRPRLGMDRWYITALISGEKSTQPILFHEISPNGAFNQIKVPGSMQRYYVGIGFGYKILLWKQLALKIEMSSLRQFTGKFPKELKEKFPNINKESNHVKGLRFNLGIGFRLQKK